MNDGVVFVLTSLEDIRNSRSRKVSSRVCLFVVVLPLSLQFITGGRKRNDTVVNPRSDRPTDVKLREIKVQLRRAT